MKVEKTLELCRQNQLTGSVNRARGISNPHFGVAFRKGTCRLEARRDYNLPELIYVTEKSVDADRG